MTTIQAMQINDDGLVQWIVNRYTKESDGMIYRETLVERRPTRDHPHPDPDLPRCMHLRHRLPFSGLNDAKLNLKPQDWKISMNKPKHTPGPWMIANNTDTGPIASAPQAEPVFDGISYAERKANAQLIASSPELLSELKNASRRWRYQPVF